MVDTFGVVDEDGEAIWSRELDGKDLDARQGSRKLPSNLLRQRPLLFVRGTQKRGSFNKNGRCAPISSSR